MKKALAASLVLLGSAFLLYRKAARLWWTYDSPWLLHIAAGRRWTEAFTQADTRQNLFTPLLTATNEAWLALFGFRASWWYVAQVVLIALTAMALFAVLRLYADAISATAGALLFVLGPPVASTAATLYILHYFEAILFGGLAALLFVLGVRRGRFAMSVASALVYLLALCAKEIAVPLPAVLLLLPEATPRTRVRHLVPHALALVAYAAWRVLVIRVPLAGYGWTVTAAQLATLPWRLLVACAGASLLAGLLAIAAMLAGAAPAMRSRRAALRFAVALLCAIAPIVPVSAEMQDRFALPLWVVLCCACAVGVARVRSLAVVAIVLALIANRQEWADEFTRNERMSDEAYVWVLEQGDVLLRNPAIPAGTMPELEWLKEEQFGHAKGARWFYDDLFLCTHPLEGRRILEWNPRTRQVEEVRVDAKRFCDSIRGDAPLAAEFVHRGDTLSWRFGPYRDGAWRIVLADGEHAWDVPREGAYRLGMATGIPLRVGYRSPEGWVTYSPELVLDFQRRPKTVWRR